MQIVVLSHEFPGKAVKLVKMFLLKPHKINFNLIPETIMFGVYSCVFIEFVYSILDKIVYVCCFNVSINVKKDF